jgi:O-antigen/teichoic acid export membrane protein
LSIESLRDLFRTFRNRRFAWNVGALGITSALAQALNAVAFLILAWLYAQDDIGIFSVFLSFGVIIATIALFSYQFSVLNADDEEFAALLWALIGLSVLAGVLTGLAFAAFGYSFAAPLALFVSLRSLSAVVDKVNTRQESFRPLIGARLAAPSVFLVLVVVLTAFSRDAHGLVWSQVLAYVLVTSVYAVGSLRAPLSGSRLDIRASVSVLIAHRRFSAYVFPAQLLNLTAFYLPTIFIERYLGAGMAAQYALTQRLCQVPVTVIANAVGQAYHGRLAAYVRTGVSGVYARFSALSRGLWLAAAALGLIMFTVFPPVLRWLLGEQWALAADLVRIMSPLFATMIVAVPLSVTFYVLDRQGYALAAQTAIFLSSAVGFGYAVVSGELATGVALFVALAVLANVYVFVRIRRITCERFAPLSPQAS